MVVQQTTYAESDLDGQESGGFVVLNVAANTGRPIEVLEDTVTGAGYFGTLDDARAACERFRVGGDNDQIFVYALIGVREALALHPDNFQLA